MKRFLLVFFLVGCSIASLSTARADSIDYSGAGSLSDHTASQFGSASPGKAWSVTTILIEIDDTSTGHIQTGNLGIVTITTSTLSQCGTALCFSGGSLDIKNKNGGEIFDMSFLSGTILKFGGSTFFNATLANGGTTMIASNTGSFSSDSVINGVAAVTPEVPGIALLGAGLIGLAGLRKLIA